MASHHKIVWSEGMFLRPHHFQQWDRYHESLLNSRLRLIMPLYWGIMDLDIHKEGLESGMFTLFSCHGIMPEGSYIDIPEIDDPPPSRTIEEHFDPSTETLSIYLATPVDRPGSRNCRLNRDDEPNITRYFRGSARVADENTGANEREISVAKRDMKIIFGNESRDEHECLKIAELERTPEGKVALRETYIPPCISISASERLMRLVRLIIDLIVGKSDDFSKKCRQRADGVYETEPTDLSNLWVLQTINAYIPGLNRYYNTRRGHPEEVFDLLVRLAGELTAFTSRFRPMDLPIYSHEDPSNSFEELEMAIQELLRILSPVETTVGYVAIPLNEVRRSVHEASIAGYLTGKLYSFFLAIRGEGQEDLITEVPRHLKIASPDGLDMLMGRALPGIRLAVED
jgi:type VI secretion system protein ImpJ